MKKEIKRLRDLISSNYNLYSEDIIERELFDNIFYNISFEFKNIIDMRIKERLNFYNEKLVEIIFDDISIDLMNEFSDDLRFNEDKIIKIIDETLNIELERIIERD